MQNPSIQKTEQETKLVVQHFFKYQHTEIPKDIVSVILLFFIDYQWSGMLFNCTARQLRFIIVECEAINAFTECHSDYVCPIEHKSEKYIYN